MPHAPWLAVRRPLPARRALPLKAVAFLIPVVLWCVVSYVPAVWHPQRLITDAGGSENFSTDQRLDAASFEEEQAKLTAAHQPLMTATKVNPIFLPAPHEVGRALYTAFTTPPARKGSPWLYERIEHSILILFEAFALACVIAVPLGLICGTFDFFSKLIEPFIDFMRYLPAPAFGALMIAIFSLNDQPKIAVIFIGLFFNMLLVTANTTRTLDPALLEAAQTLGASRKRLVFNVVVPGVLPMLYTDLRIALGFGWVYLTIAETIGEMSGITEFINQQGKFRNYPNVFTGIIVLGVLGFITDQFLGYMGTILFPWHSRRKKSTWLKTLTSRITVGRPHSGFESATPHAAVLQAEAVDARA
ncbi:MAG: NitT/TauT family transport system permease protein [Phycisphaerales bacterium]|nr:NitT/TauT family transport system permease protein [Phycisphaerales bacterium]